MSSSLHFSRIVQAKIAENHSKSKSQYDRQVQFDLEDFAVGEYAYAKPLLRSRGEVCSTAK